MRRFAFLFSILLACVAGAQDIRVGRAPGAVTASTSVQTPLIKDNAGATRIAIPSNSTTTITSTAPTTGSAVAHVIDTTGTYVSGDKLTSIRNNGAEQWYLNGTGSVSQNGANYVFTNTGTATFKSSVSDSGGAKTSFAFFPINALANASSNIFCGYSDNGTTSQLCLRKDGSLIPSNDGVSTLGTAANRFNSVYTANLIDSASVFRFSAGTTAGNAYRGNIATSGTAAANKFGNAQALTTAGDHIAEFYNDNLSTLKLSIDKDGSLIPGSDVTIDIGSTTNRVNDLYVQALRANNTANRIVFNTGTNGGNSFLGSISTSAAAVPANRFGNVTSLTTSGDQLAGFYNDGVATERSYIGYDGSYNGLVNAVGGEVVSQISPPTGLAVSCSTTGGTLAAGTYAYRVTSMGVGSTETLPATEATGIVASGTTGSCTPTWTAVLGSIGYKVYARASGAELLAQTITNPTTVSWVDTGSVTPSGALPTSNATGVLQVSRIRDLSNSNRIVLGSSSNQIYGTVTNTAGNYGTQIGNTTGLTGGNGEPLAIYSDALVTKVAEVDANGGYTVDGSGNVTVQTGNKFCLNGACSWFVGSDANGLVFTPTIHPVADNNVDLGLNGTRFRNVLAYGADLKGKVTSYNGTATAGLGVSPTYAYGSLSASTLNGAVVASYTPAAQGVFEVGGTINVTAYTSGNTGLQLLYTDCQGTARTITLLGQNASSTTQTTLTATGILNLFPETICANAASISLRTTMGTSTTDFYGWIKQIN